MERTVRVPAPLGADRISVFCTQLALIQKAGIGAEEGVSLLESDTGGPLEKELLAQVREKLSKSMPLSEALAETGAFPDYLIRMVEIGQASGRLEEVLSALSAYYRRESATRSAIRRAVAYPCLMAVLIALVFLILMARVLPVFRQVFAGLGMTLSPAASALLRLGSASQAMATVLSVLLILGAPAVFFLSRSRRGAALLQKLGRRLPGSGASGRAVARSRFASAMALMLSSGLPIDEAMDRTARLLEGSPLEAQLRAAQERMSAGESFPRAVEAAGILDALSSGLLSAGSRAGATEEAMRELAARCREEADARLALLLGRFEYALVLILCFSVGFVLLSVMLPLLGAMSAIGA